MMVETFNSPLRLMRLASNSLLPLRFRSPRATHGLQMQTNKIIDSNFTQFGSLTFFRLVNVNGHSSANTNMCENRPFTAWEIVLYIPITDWGFFFCSSIYNKKKTRLRRALNYLVMCLLKFYSGSGCGGRCVHQVSSGNVCQRNCGRGSC